MRIKAEPESADTKVLSVACCGKEIPLQHIESDGAEKHVTRVWYR
jgi:hypothetical protein